jgi:ubiquinone/menaquinone biosynthesis C-methylase UbiE
MEIKPKRDPLEEERNWWDRGGPQNNKDKPLPARHHFAHAAVRSRLYDALLELGCNSNSLILEVGCGAGEDAVYVQKASKNIIGVDVSPTALKQFKANGFEGILANTGNLPFPDCSFDYIMCSGLLHHLVGQGDLTTYLLEFVRVTKPGGYVIALEPNVFNHSGLLMNIFNSIKPGITGLVPHERALSPIYLRNIFTKAGLEGANYVASSYVWNRYPLFISKFIHAHDASIRFMKPFNLFGWFEIIYGRKTLDHPA